MQTFNNDSTGIAVMIEALSGGYAGYRLTHVSYEAGVPDSNNVIEVRTYPAGKQGAAIEYAQRCIAG
jgi:hypothetical protein